MTGVTGAQTRKKHIFVCPFCPKIIIETQRKGSNVKIWVTVEQIYEPRGLAGRKMTRRRLIGSVEV